MRAVTTAGERVTIDCRVPRFTALMEAATGDGLPEGSATGETVHLEIQRERGPFGHLGWALVARGVWSAPPAALLIDACSSGFDLLIEPVGQTLQVAARYRPAARVRALNGALAGRFRQLAAQTLLHYPALWWASQRGRVPLHASAMEDGGSVTLLAGPSGVGKSTLLAAGLSRGAVATADNLCACDTRSAYGLVEALRVEGGGRAPAAAHGRREYPWPRRVPSLDPDQLVVLRRAAAGSPCGARPLGPEESARELVAGTYMAGELRRFWPFAATLALATGIGSPHPDVTGVASALAARLPCLELRLSRRTAEPLSELLGMAAAA